MLHWLIMIEWSYLIVWFDKNNNPQFTYQSSDENSKIDVSKEIKDCDKVIVINISNIRDRVLAKVE